MTMRAAIELTTVKERDELFLTSACTEASKRGRCGLISIYSRVLYSRGQILSSCCFLPRPTQALRQQKAREKPSMPSNEE